MEEEKIIKKIQIEQSFADTAHISFRQKKYGITSCCDTDLDPIAIKKELCDWEGLKKDIPPIISLSSEIFTPIDLSIPCLDPLAPSWCILTCGDQPENAQQIRDQITELEAHLKELQDELITLQNELAIKEAELGVLEDQVAELESIMETLLGEIKLIEAQIETVVTELKDLLAQYEEECS